MHRRRVSSAALTTTVLSDTPVTIRGGNVAGMGGWGWLEVFGVFVVGVVEAGVVALVVLVIGWCPFGSDRPRFESLGQTPFSFSRPANIIS